MFDASAKFPSGILSGNTFYLGNYDECIGINVQLDNDVIKGQYCLPKITIEIPNIPLSNSTDENDNFLSTWSKIQARETPPNIWVNPLLFASSFTVFSCY